MPIRRIVSGLLLFGVLLATFAIAPTVRAQCAGPSADLLERRAAPGDELSLRGQYWATECHDVIACSQGCLGTHCTGGEPSPFARGLIVQIRRQGPGGHWQTIATGIDAGPDYRIKAQLALPDDVMLGQYDVRVRGSGIVAAVPHGLDVVATHT